MKKNSFQTFLKFKNTCLLLLIFSISAAFGQNPYTIHFQGETIEMPENINTFRWSQMPESSRLDNGYTGWVQFYETPSQAVQDLFKNNHLELLNYIPQKAYLFHFPENTSINFLKNNGVKTIIPVPGQTKLSSVLKNPPYESWAMEGNHILVTLQHLKNVTTQFVIDDLAHRQISVKQQFMGSNIIYLAIPNNCLDELSNLAYVKWVDLIPAPSIPDDFKGRSLHRASNLDTQTDTGRNYTGEGIGVLVRDDGRVGPHIDFEGRITNITNIPNESHGDGVAGIMAGAGNINPRNRGMAAGSSVFVVQYQSHFLDSQTTTLINNGDVQITNSSYSNGCNAGYTTTTQTVDQQTLDTPSLLHVFSAGNSNFNDCGYGAGNQWGNITGGHKQGKNVIATANVYFDGTLENSSSRGPAHDGRIKPDITAHGQGQISTNENNTYQAFGGTSGAAPGIAGVSAQLYEAYADLHGGDFPPSALIKAILLNTANEAGNIGPDYKFGWGIVNGLQAVKIIENEHYLSGNITQGGTNTHTINVPSGTSQVRFMVYWSDVAATPGANPALVNDLDLVVSDPANVSHLPWILDPTPDPITLNLPATNGADHLNNMEQVLLNNPASGDYDLEISGFNVPVGPQEYFVVYELISENLTVTYPNAGEHFTPNFSEVIHWDATNTTDDYVLDYSLDNGATWNPIATVDHGTQLYSWQVVDEITGEALIRVTSGAFQDVSDETFDIARNTNVYNVVQVCDETATFEWNAVDDAESYDLYLLGEKYMEIVASSTTNSVTIPITDPADSFWYALVAKNDTAGWETFRNNAKFYAGGLLDCELGVEENLFANAISLFPNPASNEVIIKINDLTFGDFEATLYNSLGQSLQKTEGKTTAQTTINVSRFASGLYFVTIKSGRNSITKKLIIY